MNATFSFHSLLNYLQPVAVYEETYRIPRPAVLTKTHRPSPIGEEYHTPIPVSSLIYLSLFSVIDRRHFHPSHFTLFTRLERKKIERPYFFILIFSYPILPHLSSSSLLQLVLSSTYFEPRKSFLSFIFFHHKMTNREMKYSWNR